MADCYSYLGATERFRSIAKERGLKINEYGIFNERDEWLAGETEEEVYRFLGMNYIPPEKRLNKGEIDQAMHKKTGQNIK